MTYTHLLHGRCLQPLPLVVGGVGLPKNADLGLGAGIANTDDDIVNKICHFGAKVIKLQVFFLNLMHRFIFGSDAF
jgi:hypothetical protein